MAFQKPHINQIHPDLKNVSIFIRSVKKFGKSTLFRDCILRKYNDPSRGLLIEFGKEKGDKLLDNLNTTHVNTYKEAIELLEWLIKTKGTEHDIEIVGLDTLDELIPMFDQETVRQSNLDNPKKQVKSIKAAMGGYTAGEVYSASLIKDYVDKLQTAGMQVWAISHSKFKNIKDKANVDNEGYMQLTSNLGASYESAMGDTFDVILTGMIDRDVREEVDKSGDEKKTRRYATDSIRKLYFRGTPEIDAGCRFAAGAVPEYLVFDKPDMSEEFIRIIEEGMEKSKLSFRNKEAGQENKKIIIQEEKPEPTEDDLEIEDVRDRIDDFYDDRSVDELREEVQNLARNRKDLVGDIKAILRENKCKLSDITDPDILHRILNLA